MLRKDGLTAQLQSEKPSLRLSSAILISVLFFLGCTISRSASAIHSLLADSKRNLKFLFDQFF